MAAEIHNVSHVEPASAMALVGEGGSITTSLFRTPGRHDELRHPRSRLGDAGDEGLLVEPPAGSRNLTPAREVALSQRTVRRRPAAPAHGHAAIGLGQVVLVEAQAQLGIVSLGHGVPLLSRPPS